MFSTPEEAWILGILTTNLSNIFNFKLRSRVLAFKPSKSQRIQDQLLLKRMEETSAFKIAQMWSKRRSKNLNKFSHFINLYNLLDVSLCIIVMLSPPIHTWIRAETALRSNASHLWNRITLQSLLWKVLTAFFHFQVIYQPTRFNVPRTLAFWEISSNINLQTSSNILFTHKEIQKIHSIQTHHKHWITLFLSNLKEEWLMEEDSTTASWRAHLCI